MDKQEAKMILQSYRPGGQDAGDPAFAEALALARLDPELGEWFRQQTEFDQALSERLPGAPVPVDLRNAILAGHRSDAQLLRPAFTWWKSPALAWAAAIVLLFAVAFLFRDEGQPTLALAAYRTAMTGHLDRGFKFDVQSGSPAELQKWLEFERKFGAVELPPELGAGESIGCRIFDFEAKQSALICFTLPSKEVVHLFMTDGRAFDAAGFDEGVICTPCSDWNTATWRQGSMIYLLVGRVAEGELVEIARTASR